MKLVVLANAFPYGYWEPYLETESKFYRGYDAVDLFALSVRQDQWAIKRELESNIRVHAIPFQKKQTYIKSLLKSGFKGYVLKEALKGFRVGKSKTASAKLLATFVSRAHFECNVIVNELLANGYSTTEEFVLYSYRMEYHAYLCLLLKARFPNAHVVLRGHRYDLYEELSASGYFPFRNEAFSAADLLVAISAHGLDYLSSKYPSFKGKIELRKLGTLDHGIAPYSDAKEIRIVSISNVVPVKRVHLIAEALLACTDYSVIWTHFGAGSEFDQLKEVAASLPKNIQANLNGVVSNEQLLDYLKTHEFDFLLNVSESEGIPVSFMEAMSFGIPVIATDVGGSSEIVIDGYNGVLLPPHSKSQDILNAIKSFQERSEESKSAMRVRARTFWSENHNAKVLYESFNRELQQLESLSEDS